jgi:hypothetical protein
MIMKNLWVLLVVATMHALPAQDIYHLSPKVEMLSTPMMPPEGVIYMGEIPSGVITHGQVVAALQVLSKEKYDRFRSKIPYNTYYVTQYENTLKILGIALALDAQFFHHYPLYYVPPVEALRSYVTAYFWARLGEQLGEGSKEELYKKLKTKLDEIKAEEFLVEIDQDACPVKVLEQCKVWSLKNFFKLPKLSLLLVSFPESLNAFEDLLTGKAVRSYIAYRRLLGLKSLGIDHKPMESLNISQLERVKEGPALLQRLSENTAFLLRTNFCYLKEDKSTTYVYPCNDIKKTAWKFLSSAQLQAVLAAEY